MQKSVAAPTPLTRALLACRPHLLAVAVFSAFLNLLYLAPTLYMLQVYDRVLPTGGGVTLFMVSVILVFALATLSCLDTIRSRLLARCSARLDNVLARPVLFEVMAQPGLSRVDRTRLIRDFDTFRGVVSGGAAVAAFDAPWLVIYLLAAYMLHPALGALCMLGAGAMFGLAYLNEKLNGGALSNANAAASVAYARQDQVSASAAEVRALGMVSAVVDRQLAERAFATALQTEAGLSAGYIGGALKFVRLTLQSSALALAAWLAISGQISAGALMAASFLLARAVAPVEQMVASWKAIVSARDAYGSLKALFSASAPPLNRMLLPALKGGVAVEGLGVVSPLSDKPALFDVTFAVEPGEMVGIVGPSGSGKSTLVKALVGSIEATRGVVRFDGASRADWDAEQLATYVGYLPQEFVLFTGTIKDNIARFETASTSDMSVDAKVVAAAVAAGAHELILRLPHGYDTRVGLGGFGLSGGQAQRIALARALYGSPQIVVLDEPNAHLDVEGEAQLCRTITELKAAGVTILISAHRGMVLANADKVLTLVGGRVQRYSSLSQATALRSGDKGATLHPIKASV